MNSKTNLKFCKIYSKTETVFKQAIKKAKEHEEFFCLA